MIKTHRHPALLTDSFIGNFNGLMNDILNENSQATSLPKRIGINFTERDNGYVIQASLPGFDRDYIDVSIEDHLLTISASKEKLETQNHEKNHLVEIPTGKFKRTIQLPKNADSNNVDASYEHGILQLHIAKSKESLVKKVEIK